MGQCIPGRGWNISPYARQVVLKNLSSFTSHSSTTNLGTMTLATAGKWLDLDPPLSIPSLTAIATLGFVQLTPVQAATIPLFMTNKDVAVEVSLFL